MGRSLAAALVTLESTSTLGIAPLERHDITRKKTPL